MTYNAVVLGSGTLEPESNIQVQIAELNTESESRLVTGLSFHRRYESSHCAARLHFHWGTHGHFPAFSRMSTFSPSFGVCKQPRVCGCSLPFTRCGLIPLWLNASTKPIFSSVIVVSVACVCLWCVWVWAFDAVCPLRLGMWLFCPGVFLVHTRELPAFLELRL